MAKKASAAEPPKIDTRKLPVDPAQALEALQSLKKELPRIRKLREDYAKKAAAADAAEAAMDTNWTTETQFRRAEARLREKGELARNAMDDLDDSFDRFHGRAERLIRENLGAKAARWFEKMEPSWLDDVESFLSQLESQIDRQIRAGTDREAGNVVFVVHGHDLKNAGKLSQLIRTRWKSKPIVLKRTAGRGRVIWEKFEQQAATTRFALVLMTPDDTVETARGQYKQPRPNVLLELGYFLSKIGRLNVCIVCREGTKIPSDLEGISRVVFKKSIEECRPGIERELRAAGIPARPSSPKTK